MTLRACPTTVVRAPAERVWELLSEPANYGQWWDAQTRAITPAGPAQPGQRIEAETSAVGRKWIVRIVVEGVDPAQRVIHLTTRLPLGITVENHIACVPLDAASCRVTFG